MFAVIREDYNPEYNTIWGPFGTQHDAVLWISTQPDRNDLTIVPLVDPVDGLPEDLP